jgi:hypothetical protein
MRSVPPGVILRALLRGHLHGHRPQAAQESHLISSRSDGYENGNETKRKIIKRKPSKMKTKINKDVEKKICQRITSGRIRTRTAYTPATYPPTPQRRKIPQEAPRVLVGDDDVGEVEPEEAVGLFFSFFFFCQ